MSIAENLARINRRIATVADPAGITLVAASKTNSADKIREAIGAGVRVFGENRVQEMVEKTEQHAYDGAELHFIGHLQSNKVKQVVGRVGLIQSVGSLKLAELIDGRARELGIVQRVLAEINVGNEDAKTGFSVEFFDKNLYNLTKLPNISLCGLMTIPPVVDDPQEAAYYFEKVAKIAIDISPELCDNGRQAILSMGMSADLEVAIAAGANMIRVGAALFGTRERAGD
ncbi:YggS family pyridoxal phosphate enzyme [Clostridia bacterium]|nr:YggS family pyridoxal phosphate enzyme [Clostridia bacterium]